MINPPKVSTSSASLMALRSTPIARDTSLEIGARVDDEAAAATASIFGLSS